MCAFYRQPEFYTSLFGLVLIITLSFVVLVFLFANLAFLDSVIFCVVVLCLCRTFPLRITWMSQREQPDRVCKRKKQGQVLSRGNSSSSVERSSDTSVLPSPLSSSDLAAVSSIPSESSSIAGDISDITIVSPEGERSNYGENSSASPFCDSG